MHIRERADADFLALHHALRAALADGEILHGLHGGVFPAHQLGKGRGKTRPCRIEHAAGDAEHLRGAALVHKAHARDLDGVLGENVGIAHHGMARRAGEEDRERERPVERNAKRRHKREEMEKRLHILRAERQSQRQRERADSHRHKRLHGERFRAARLLAAADKTVRRAA